METRDFPGNPRLGLTRKFHYDHVADEFHIETQFKVEKDLIQHRFNSFDERARWADDMNHVAQIPMPIYFQLKDQGILDDDKRFRAWLNDRDNNVFRTRPGKV